MKQIMYKAAIVIMLFALVMPIATADCPVCKQKKTEDHCQLIIGENRTLEGIDIFLAYGLNDDLEPVEGTEVEIQYYNAEGLIEKEEFLTGKNGHIYFDPEFVGYYIIDPKKDSDFKAIGITCEDLVPQMIYVDTICGDAVCAGNETSLSCAIDCANCGDAVCSEGENASNCADCSICGDGVCTIGESRHTCPDDCMICGDGFCDYIENGLNCPDDCGTGIVDGVCDQAEDDICDPDCNSSDSDPDCMIVFPEVEVSDLELETTSANSSDLDILPFVIIAIILIVITLVFVLRKRPNNKKPEPKKKTKSEK